MNQKPTPTTRKAPAYGSGVEDKKGGKRKIFPKPLIEVNKDYVLSEESDPRDAFRLKDKPKTFPSRETYIYGHSSLLYYKNPLESRK